FSFHYNNEHFPGVKRYNKKELELVEYILKYNVFEIWDTNDIIREINRANRDANKILELLKEYYNGIGEKVDEIIKDHEVKLPIRDYAKTKWELYKKKMDEAIFKAMREIDWFRDFIEGVDKKIEDLEVKIRELNNFIDEERRKLEEELRRRFEVEKEKIRLEIEMKKNRELQEMLKKELRKVEEEYKELINKLNSKIRELEREKTSLKEEKEKLESLLDKIRKAKKEGSRFVRLEDALYYEEWFIGRLEKKLDEIKRGVNIEGKNFKLVSVREYYEFPDPPRNREIVAILEEKKLIPIGKKERIKFIGKFLANKENFRKMGFDTYPISLSEIIKIIDSVRYEDFDKIVILIASPTGFSKEVMDFVESEDFRRRYLSKKIALAIFDVEVGKLYYNEIDEYVKALAPVLSLEFDREKIERLKKYIDENIIIKGYVTLEEAAELVGDERLAKKVFYEYKGGECKYIKDVGLVLVKK
ncbi:hypothetical protein, partial [Methanocaldococcus infernus]